MTATPTAVPVVLDAAQQAVIALAATASGTVVGAPGSGKTATVLARYRALLDAGLGVDEVVVLTPTRQTATALRDRLALAAGQATAGPPARSIASLAFQLVRAAHVHAGQEPPQLLTGADEDQLLRDLLDGDADDEHRGTPRWPEALSHGIRSTRGFRDELRAFLAECTTLGVGPDRLRRLAVEQSAPVWESVASFFAEYLEVRGQLRGAHRDPATLVREAVALLRASSAHGPDPLGALAAVRAVLVDDAQELTLGGVELIEAWHARGAAVVVFGDPDVGAGAFRGATPENFARLARLGDLHVLDGAHRGTAACTDLVRQVTARIGAAGVVVHRRPPVRPDASPPDGSLRAVLARSPAEEYDVIARALRERHVHDGVPWSRCAVIAHDTRQVAAIEAELTAREVPARSSSASRALAGQRPVRDLLRLVALAARAESEWAPSDALEVLTGIAGGLDPVQLRRLRTALRHAELAADGTRAGGALLVAALHQPLEFDLLDTREARRAAAVGRTLEALRAELARGATAHELLWTAWSRSGRERAWLELARGAGVLAEQANRDLDAVVALFQSAKRYDERQAADTDPLAFVRALLDSDVADDRLDAPAARESVQVLTPAAALGTEFDTVVVAGVQDRVWPNTRLRGGLLQTWMLRDAVTRPGATPAGVIDRRREALHDELRLFARAVSRARQQVLVTAVSDDDLGPSVLFELLPTPTPPRAVSEHPLTLRGLVAAHRRTLTTVAAAAPGHRHAAGQLALLSRAGIAGADPSQWYGVAGATSPGGVRDAGGVRVSPSRLRALEECELNWVLAELGGDCASTVAGLGTIIHAALERSDGTDEDALWRCVAERWGELVFESGWRERAERARARDLVRRLHVYLRDFDRSGARLLGAEPHFEVPLPIDVDGGVVLSGYIDRVEVSAGGEVVICDLKTGKNEPQSDAKVLDDPQLSAYQLAFEAGAIEGTSGLRAGGAKLLVLRPTATRKDYVTAWQPPLDEERRSGFLARLAAAARVMTGDRFGAPFEEHCRDEHAYGICRIHTVGPVSAP